MNIHAYSTISDLSPTAQRMLVDAGIDLEVNDSIQRPDEDALVELVQKYDILIIGAKEKMTQRVFDAATKLKVIGSLSIGLDHIADCFKRTDKYSVVNTPTANVVSVAEHTFALILALRKKLLEGNQSVIDGTGRRGVSGSPKDITNYTLGIIGAGKIAKSVFEISKAFKMPVYCYTFHPERHKEFEEQGASFVDLNKLLCVSDIITVHLPLTDESRNMINERNIGSIKSNAIIINTSRADITDISVLLNRADSEPGFSVGLDIDIDEYLPLLEKRRNNVLITPHMAGISSDAINRMDTELANNLIHWLQTSSSAS